jgi:hypothetical protein
MGWDAPLSRVLAARHARLCTLREYMPYLKRLVETGPALRLC